MSYSKPPVYWCGVPFYLFYSYLVLWFISDILLSIEFRLRSRVLVELLMSVVVDSMELTFERIAIKASSINIDNTKNIVILYLDKNFSIWSKISNIFISYISY